MAKYLSPFDVWAIAFGCMVGWGAFVMPGTTFLPLAGPAGSIVSLAVSTVIILIVGRNYAFLMARSPDTGGVYAYTKEAFGREHAFLSSWFVTLSYLTIVFLNATALFIIARTMLGGYIQAGFHYQIAGHAVYLSEIVLSAGVLVVVGLLFILAKPVLQKLQTALAAILGLGIVAIIVITLPHMDFSVLTQFSGTAGVNPGVAFIAIVVLAPWAFVGFDIASLETAHFRFKVRKSWQVIAISIVSAGIAYIGLTIVSLSEIPAGYESWAAYIGDLDNLSGIISVPPFFAMNEVLGKAGIAIAVITAIAAILTGVIGASRATVRMLSTMAEDRILSKEFLGTTFCILFVMGISILISFLGRNALNWFVELTSLGAVVGFAYVSAAAYHFAKVRGDRQIQVTGIAGTVISIIFGVVLLISQFGPVETMSHPAFALLAVWCLLGFLFYWRTTRQSKASDTSGVSVSGAALFSMLFYCVMMWMTKSLLSASPTAEMSAIILRNAIVMMIAVAVGLGVMFYIQHILRKKQEELTREKMHAEESSKAKSQFLFNMSHDIRTPANAIMGYAHLASREEDVPPKVKEYVDKIGVSGKHLVGIIDDILEMSRIESGQLELVMDEADLVEVVESVAGMFENQAREKGLDLIIDTSQAVDTRVICDSKHVARVVQNLLSNACKFTPKDGTVRLSLDQIESLDENRSNFELRVKDTGIGMNPEFVERLFDEFERERTSTVSGIQGTGLGMSIAKGIIDKMGGTITVDTAPGQGTEFIVRMGFDRAATDVEPEDVSKADSEKELADCTGKHVLLVEDNEINREIMTMILDSYGLTVEEAENGQEAVDAVRVAEPGHYDVVLMDVQMPIMDGYEATREIRALPDKGRASIPIIAVTANAYDEDVSKALDLGMNGHVSKPVDPQKLIEKLAEVL